MSADVPRGACLQCEQTREEVRINRTICGSDFTPTTDLIRCTYIVDVADKNDGVMVGDASYEFDRWFAAHDREVAEKAWDEGFMRANRLVNCRMCRGTTVPKINPYTV